MCDVDLEKVVKNGWIENTNKIEELFNKEINIKKESYTIQKLLDKHDDKFCTPNKDNIFNAFKLFSLAETRVVILGQDPYPDKKSKKADGLAFSQNGKKIAVASLKNIFNAIDEYLNKNKIKIKKNNENFNPNLKIWARDNKVLLLNTALTYDDNLSHTQRKKIWEPFISRVIYKLLTCKDTPGPLVIFLWGGDAQETFNDCLSSYSINCNNYNFSCNKEITRRILVLQCSHPKAREKDNTFKKQAPKQFEQCNKFLKDNAVSEINWQNI